MTGFARLLLILNSEDEVGRASREEILNGISVCEWKEGGGVCGVEASAENKQKAALCVWEASELHDQGTALFLFCLFFVTFCLGRVFLFQPAKRRM